MKIKDFKVGESPEWTKKLVEQLPHGSVLECAYNKKEFTYVGQKLDYDAINDLRIKDYFGTNRSAYFEHARVLAFAKIISLPEASAEPKAGDMVEVSDDGKTWVNAYNWFLIGKSINRNCYYCESDGQTQAYWEYIRLPQKSEVESKAEELMGNMLPLKFVGSENTYINWGAAKEKIHQAIKWGQDNPDKK
jgi:hypothetical protein